MAGYRVKRVSVLRHGRYRIRVYHERCLAPFGFIARLEWSNNGDAFCATVRNPDGPLGRFLSKDAAIAEAKVRCAELNGGEPYLTVLAEWCDGPFYMGWHLYLREHCDGRRNRDGDWGWLRGAGQEGFPCAVRDLLIELGHSPPPPTSRGSDAFAEWFAKTFPRGLRVFDEGSKFVALPPEEQPDST